jgi:coenzyme F420-reducing hydrogenase gamma subunit
MLEMEAVIRDGKLVVMGADGEAIEVDPAVGPSSEDLERCNASGPVRGVRCNEPEGHVGDSHQHQGENFRVAWAREGE